jgi:molybdopterin biosynthesis enzyme
MTVIEWIGVIVAALVVFVLVVFPLIEGVGDLFANSPRRREAQLRYRIADAHDEVSGVFAAARDKMNRRAGLDDSFRLGRGSGSRW